LAAQKHGFRPVGEGRQSGVNNHRFVFVCGLQRSGTRTLYRYLSEHPQISNSPPPEPAAL